MPFNTQFGDITECKVDAIINSLGVRGREYGKLCRSIISAANDKELTDYINAQINNVNDILFELKTADKLNEKYDFVCANILHNVLAEIMSDLKRIMKIGAKIVLSGILEEKQQVVIDAFEKNNLKLIEKMQQKEWVAFVVERED